MSNYTPITDFGAKDLLATGHPDKLLKGAEIDAELGGVSVAIASKAEGTATAVEVVVATFTPVYGATGFSADPTGLLRYQIIGDGTHDYVVLTDDAAGSVTGTSDATSWTITGIPTAIRPDATVNTTISTDFNDATGDAMCFATVAADGVMTFYMMNGSGVFATTAWTNSGTKGFGAGFVLMWPLVITA